MKRTDYIKALAQSFQDLHGLLAKHIRSVPIKETFQGKIIWDGRVEVFNLIGHLKATRGYAWGFIQNGKLKVTSVLGLPPVKSPRTAVKAAAVASQK